MANYQSVEILLIEDDPGDVELTKEMLETSKLHLNLHVAKDGVEGMSFLNKEDGFEDVPTPDLILLDLNMPRKDGRETLVDIRSTPDLKHIPVVILTTSSSNLDIIKSYTEGANSYVTKPVGLPEFQKVLNAIEGFWFTIVKLPRKE